MGRCSMREYARTSCEVGSFTSIGIAVFQVAVAVIARVSLGLWGGLALAAEKRSARTGLAGQALNGYHDKEISCVAVSPPCGKVSRLT